MTARLVHLDVIFGDGEEQERPDLARLLHLRRNGACSGMGPDAFFPERGRSALPAKEVCWVCPVRAECLRYAMEERIWWGIWGGFSEKERRALNILNGQGVPVDQVVAMALAGDLDEAIKRRRAAPRVPTSRRRNLPYGWTVEGSEVVPDAGEQEVIARLKAWCRDGATPHEAAERLNAEGVRTRRGADWAFASVKRILDRPSPQAVDERQAS